MDKNVSITIVILFAMILVISGFIVFLWGIISYSKRYGKKLKAVSQANLPSAFVLKSSPGSFLWQS